MATSKIVKPNNEAPDDLEKEVAGVRISFHNVEISIKIFRQYPNHLNYQKRTKFLVNLVIHKV